MPISNYRRRRVGDAACRAREFGVPHLHLYREGYGDKWAVEVPDGILSNPADAWQVLHDFMRYCGVVEQPNIVRGLFS